MSPKRENSLANIVVERISTTNGLRGFDLTHKIFVPNQFFDVVLRTSCRNVIRLVAYVMLATLQYKYPNKIPHGSVLRISLRELSKKAGISRSSLKATIKQAIDLKYLTVTTLKTADSPLELSLQWCLGERYTTKFANFDGFFSGKSNYTVIPVAYFDVVVRHETLSVSKVVGTILRQTLGWSLHGGLRRQSVSLSISAFQRYSGIRDRTTVLNAIARSIRAGFIHRTKNGFFDVHGGEHSRPAEYALFIATDYVQAAGGEQAPIAENQTGYVQKTPPASGAKKPTGIKTDPINKIIHKQQQTNKDPDTAAQDVAYAALRQHGIDHVAALKLSRKYTPQEIQRQIDWLSKRNPARNSAGLLRTAIENNYPDPNGSGAGTVSEEQSGGHVFVKHFYAAMGGNRDEPFANASRAEAEAADSFIRRLGETLGREMEPARIGRIFGKFCKYHSRNQHAALRSIVPNLRWYGDQFATHLSERPKQLKTQNELTRLHQQNAELRKVWLAYVGEEEEKYRVVMQDEYFKFQGDRECRRNELINPRAPIITKHCLDYFDGDECRLIDFQCFFCTAVLSFEAWKKCLAAKTQPNSRTGNGGLKNDNCGKETRSSDRRQ